MPLRYYHKKWATGDRHSYAQLTRFLPEPLLECFERVSLESTAESDAPELNVVASDVRKKIAAMWV